MRAMKFFNVTGPCNPEDHYMLPPEKRLVGAQLNRYVRDKLFWVLHAPRQVGKTTFLKSWARELNAKGEVVACYVTIEDCQRVEDYQEVNQLIYTAICNSAVEMKMERPEPPVMTPRTLFADTLREFARRVAPKPLVILFDEVDVLGNDPVVRFLRQLRAGYASRAPGVFPVSVALVGMRDLKDYIQQAKDGQPVNPGSPFNIKSDSATIGNFTKEDLALLFSQRTSDTGQQIMREALDYVWEQSQGQPWIVNNLYMRATMRVLAEDDYSTVELKHVQAAREQMVLARETHLDALAYRLDNPEVRRVIEMILVGDNDMRVVRGEGLRLCVDLGLVVNDNKGGIRIANPVYREVLAREISFAAQSIMPTSDHFRWQKPDGSCDMDLLLAEFQKFWRRNSEVWEVQSDYVEAFPHLLLMAFLQRLLNGGGHINREFALGRGRLDLHIEFKGDEFLLEIKLLRDYDTPESVLEEGLEQITRYRDSLGPHVAAYLLIFDRRSPDKKLPWEKRIYKNIHDGGITVVGL